MKGSKIHLDGFRYKETPITSGLVYQHMSSHYRRILNAKPAVDTSAPQSFKHRQTRSAKPRKKSSCRGDSLGSSVCSRDPYQLDACSVEDLALIDRIVSDDKYSPADVCRLQWSKNTRKYNTPASQLKAVTNHISRKSNHEERKPEIMKNRKSGDVIELHSDQFEALRLNFWPRILKTNAASKLRDMRVYHPPRRKTVFEKVEWNSSERDDRACGCREECNCGTAGPAGKEPSQASSRDSAYNGGTSSTPDSRSPTPSSQKAPRVRHIATQTEVVGSKRTHSRKRSEARDASNDFAYTKFINDITIDVVEKGQYTDKSLSRIIRRHIAANIAVLDKGRMLEEATKLREQLGMPAYDEDTDVLKSSATIPSFSEVLSESSTVSESWTTHYLQLSDSKQLRSVKSDNCITAEEVAVDSVRTDEEIEEEDEIESDSSRETTIKEVMRSSSWLQVNEQEEDDEEESIEVGSYVSGDDFSE